MTNLENQIKLGKLDYLEQKIKELMLSSKCYSTMYTGTVVECLFESIVEKYMPSKIPDLDKKRRYDYDLNINNKIVKVEVKTCNSKGEFSISLKDKQTYTLSNGSKITTTLRHRSYSFDYLAVNCCNISNDINDFRYVSFKDIPGFKITNRNFNRWKDKDIKVLEAELFPSSCKIENLKYIKNLDEL
jgi:hypothetical protein